MKRLALVAALIVAGAAPATANEFAAGLAAYDNANYVAAFEAWQPLAIVGDPVAESNVGVLYDKGLGVPQDYSMAAMWCRRAAEQGYAVAQFNLALLYKAGLGVATDEVEALEWLRQAAERGLAKAQYRLGAHYANGEGVPQDFPRAFVWFGRAAQQGYRAADAGRDFVERRMTPAEVAIATALLRRPETAPSVDAEPVLGAPQAAPLTTVDVAGVPAAAAAAARPRPKPPAPTAAAPRPSEEDLEIVPAAGPPPDPAQAEAGAARPVRQGRVVDRVLMRMLPSRLDLQQTGRSR